MRLVAILLASYAWGQTPSPSNAPTNAPTSAPPIAPSIREVMRAALEKQQAAAARQRESVRKQADSLGVWLPPGNTADAQPEPPSLETAAPVGSASAIPCDPLPEATLAPIIEGVARTQDLETRLLRAVIEQESGFRPCALSPRGAKGLMQLMPDTASDLGVTDPFSPQQNIEAGARYLKQLMIKYKGDLSQALGAYNAGPATVDQAGGVPNIRETRDYVKSILQKIGPTRTDPPSIPPPKPIEN